MKRLLSFAVIASLLFTPIAQAAPKKISVKPLQLLTTVGSPDEVSGVVTSGKSLIIFGSKASKAYARAIDTTGKELWNLSLDQSAASIATAAAVDAAGDIWIAGATPLALGLIGLAEAIPFISLVLFGGHFADNHNKKRIMQVTLSIIILASCIGSSIVLIMILIVKFINRVIQQKIFQNIFFVFVIFSFLYVIYFFL